MGGVLNLLLASKVIIPDLEPQSPEWDFVGQTPPPPSAELVPSGLIIPNWVVGVTSFFSPGGHGLRWQTTSALRGSAVSTF